MNALGIDKAPADTRVVVAMSGGVDSSVAAALMAEAGYDVVGITLQLYDHGRTVGRPGTCCAGQDIHDARRVADRLGIPHYVLDYERRFAEQVMAPFAASYLAGETPIPCVLCNQQIKFTDLLSTARHLGADALVTGHYVRWRCSDKGPALYRGLDGRRDQSYFLFSTTRDQLARLRFPLGDMTKDETRNLAARFGLTVASKRDSQDICFVPSGGYARVLERLNPDPGRPGEIVDLDGRVLGRHPGVIHFTVGQRRGLGVAAGQPLYVVRLEPETARVVVGPETALLRSRLSAGSVNWLGDEPLPDRGLRVQVKLRSTQPPVAARVIPQGGACADVVLDAPQAAIAPGQACVFYDGDRLLGGGWIRKEQQGSAHVPSSAMTVGSHLA
jgi:tRNA-specific 2-thiouridylase